MTYDELVAELKARGEMQSGETAVLVAADGTVVPGSERQA